MLLNDCKNPKDRLGWLIRLSMEEINKVGHVNKISVGDFLYALAAMTIAGGLILFALRYWGIK